MGVEVEKDSPYLREKLLANARKSLKEIAEITGLDVRDVSERLSKLFEDRGWMTERQEERLLLIELSDLIEDAKERLSDAEDAKEYASLFRGILTAMRLVANRMDARRKLVEEDLHRITLSQARLWAEAIRLAQDRATFELQKLYPEVESEIIQVVFEDSLQIAVAELEKHT